MQQSDLTHNQSTSFQLEVDFAAQFVSLAHGHLTLKWASKDRWRREITVGSFRQVEIRNGEWQYTTRNADFTPSRISELLYLLAPYDQTWQATKEKRRSVKGINENCIRAEELDETTTPPRRTKIYHDFCINTGSGDIASAEWDEGPDESRRREYDDYAEFASHRYPRKFRLLEKGSSVIIADVVSLTAANFDDSQFVPAPGAIARRECDGLKHPVLIKSPDVNFSPAARKNGGGTLFASLTVLTDGTIGDIQLTGSTNIPLDPATLKSLREYKFKPAMCGTEPVVQDVTIELGYHMY